MVCCISLTGMLLSGFVSELLTGKSQTLRFKFESSLDFLGLSFMLVADQIFLVSMLPLVLM